MERSPYASQYDPPLPGCGAISPGIACAGIKPFTRNVFLVALPMVLQSLVESSLHIVDGLMVSALGDAAYSAVTQANRFTFVFNLFSFGTCSGSAIFMSQYWGARDIKRLRVVHGTGHALCADHRRRCSPRWGCCFPVRWWPVS